MILTIIYLGIGLSFASLLLSKNCNVVLADLSQRHEAKDLVARYSASSSPRAVFVETDVTSWKALEGMFNKAYAEFGDVDILCPGAGVYEPLWSNFWLPPGSKESRDTIDANRYALLDINLTHPMRATQIALSKWLHPQKIPNSQFPIPRKVSPSNQKRVIHIASVASQIPVFAAPLYGASKFAISGFVRCVGPELETSYGIRVNAVAPGVVKTPLWLDNPEKLQVVDEKNSAWVTPEEVAEAMLECVESGGRGGGVVVEVGAGSRRVVEVLNDPGPDLSPSGGISPGNREAGERDVHRFLANASVWGRPKL